MNIIPMYVNITGGEDKWTKKKLFLSAVIHHQIVEEAYGFHTERFLQTFEREKQSLARAWWSP